MRLSHHQFLRRRSPQSGLSLMEALVALLVLTIAVISLLAIQMRTLADARNSAHRAQAVRAIDDLAERIKANPQGFSILNHFTSGWADSADAPAAPDCVTAPCTPSQLAQWDLAIWREGIRQRLPGGQARTFLSTDERPGMQRQFGILLAWRMNERSEDNDYVQVFDLDDDATPDDVTCPAQRICHLVYVQP